MADWFDANAYDEYGGTGIPATGGITGFDPNTGQQTGNGGGDGTGIVDAGTPPPTAAPVRDWPSNPVLDRIAAAFQARGITPTRELVMQWGGNIDPNYEARILSSISGLAQQAAPTAATAATAANTTANTTAGGGAGDKDGFGAAWMSSGGRTVTDLKAFADRWNAAHPTEPVTVGGSKGDKVYGPGGAFWADAVIAAGDGGGRGASWQTDTGGGSSSSGGSGGIGNGEFMTPWTDKFKAPTYEDLQNSEVMKTRLATAMKGMERSAASKGTLLTGGFQQALARENQNIASDEYDKLYNRAANEYTQDYNIFENNQAKRYNRLASISGVGQVAAGNLAASSTNYGNSQSSLYGEAGNVSAAGSTANANALSNSLSYLRDLFNNRQTA